MPTGHLLKTAFHIFAPAVAILALCSSAPAAQQKQQVDVKLVLAVDVSPSIDNSEYEVERDGTAAAFSDQDVIRAIQNGSIGRIAVTLIHFSSAQFNRVMIDWTIIRDRPSALAFAQAVRNLPRTFGRRTSISSALELGSFLLEASEKDITATRRVIDVTGDGPNNAGDPMTEAHDKTIAQGIVVNGLPVMDDQANGYFEGLDKYYAGCVTGGRGAFVVVVKSYRDYAAAMRHKLILEISDNGSATKHADTANPLVKQAAAVLPRSPLATPQVLPSRPNEYTKNCDIPFGNFGGFYGVRRF
jgi:hypothetical protein